MLNIAEFQERVARLRVCVIGETITDVFIESKPLSMPSGYCSIVVETGQSARFLGGAFPVARDLANFCESVSLITNGSTCHGLNSDNRLKVLPLGGDEFNITKTRYIGDWKSDPLFLTCQWPNEQEWNCVHSLLLAQAQRVLESTDLTIVLDFGHGLIDAAAAQAISDTARFLALNCQANGGRHPFNLIHKYSRFDMLFLNAYEARLNMGIYETQSIAALARLLVAKTNAAYAVVSDADQGAWLCRAQEVFHQKSLVRSYVDTIGCGDTMLGFSALATAANYPPASILEIGALGAAAKACMRVHEAEINPAFLSGVQKSTR